MNAFAMKIFTNTNILKYKSYVILQSRRSCNHLATFPDSFFRGIPGKNLTAIEKSLGALENVVIYYSFIVRCKCISLLGRITETQSLLR